MAKAPEKFDPSIYVHSPADLGVMYKEHYQFLLDNPGIPWGVPCLDSIILPSRPGDLVIICGRPGSGKTSLMARQAKRKAQEIAERGAQYQECVMYVSWEQHAEQMEVYFAADDEHTTSDYHWCKIPVEEIEAKARNRAGLPLWMVGYSRRHILKQTRPLTLNLVLDAVESMVYTFKDAPKPKLLCFDYAQLIPSERRRESYRLELKDVIQQTKHLGLRIGCPVIVAAQAGRQVDSYKLPIPGMADAQEGSSIEQHCDLFLGIARPWKWAEHHQPLQITSRHQVVVTPELFLLKMNKQRGEDGDRLFALQFSMAELELAGLDLMAEEPQW